MLTTGLLSKEKGSTLIYAPSMLTKQLLSNSSVKP